MISFFSQNVFNSKVALNDFRRQQFVFVADEIVLSDLDGLTFEKTNFKKIGVKHNLNERKTRNKNNDISEIDLKNLHNVHKHFISPLLPHSCPSNLLPFINTVVNLFSKTFSFTSYKNLFSKYTVLRENSYLLKILEKEKDSLSLLPVLMLKFLIETYAGGNYLTKRTNRTSGKIIAVLIK